ncbi:MAG: MGH1-like glycoside hydrolase domain-containing protein [Leadbetterella sp.]
MMDSVERKRLAEELDNTGWKKWGPYLAERQWGTVREDYSVYGDAWDFISHDMARSKAYRWGEDGLGGISDNKQLFCISVALWNHQDPILKERLFGLTNKQGNHGEDVKEQYYYLDSSPTHSYLKMLYKYPLDVFPYQKIIDANIYRSKKEPEFEISDTGIFNDSAYFDVWIEYAKASKDDVLLKIKVDNKSKRDAPITVLPTFWFRNSWSWGYENDLEKPLLWQIDSNTVGMKHSILGERRVYVQHPNDILFCENETNSLKLFGKPSESLYFKDGINNYIVNAQLSSINHKKVGTKASAQFTQMIAAGESKEIWVRFSDNLNLENAFQDFEKIFADAKSDCDDFYQEIQKSIPSDEDKAIQRQAFAGMLWNKQFYYYNLKEWVEGDPKMPFDFNGRAHKRNYEWQHAYMANVLSMPDKWEYPWFAAWDLAFHTPTLSRLDPEFAKKQLSIVLREYYMHPNGQIPAYEWNFSDVNPPVHAWAAWIVYKNDQSLTGKRDIDFLEKLFHKLLLNFTWWVNQKDQDGNNLFGGGFLGMDNIGVFDRNAQIPGHQLQQADASGWMALFTLNMLKIAIELSLERPAYQDMASKFFEHFLHIAKAINESIHTSTVGLWDSEDGFYYDKIYSPDYNNKLLKVRSLVGLLPLCAVEVFSESTLDKLPDFKRRLEEIAIKKPHLLNFASDWQTPNANGYRIFSLVDTKRLLQILSKLLSEKEFLSDFGIRSLSKFHKEQPYSFDLFGETLKVEYSAGETELNIMGGNSNWRGPIWIPLNYLIIDALKKYGKYYGDNLKVSYPNQDKINLVDVALNVSKRLQNLFKTNSQGRKAIHGGVDLFDKNPEFKDKLLFYEYFDGDTGKGLGASHQTGWTGLIADIIDEVNNVK